MPVSRYLVFATDYSISWPSMGGLVMTYSGYVGNPRPTGITLTVFTVPENSPVGFIIGILAMVDVLDDTAASWVIYGGNFALSGALSK